MKTARWNGNRWLLCLGLVSSLACGSANRFGSGSDDPEAGAGGGQQGDASVPADASGDGGGGDGGRLEAGADGAPTIDASTPDGAGGSGPPDASGGCANPTTYYADADGDGYGDALTTIEACARPGGYAENPDDCYDGNATAKPGQSGWFVDDRGDGSYDYDCDGDGVQHWQDTGNCGIGICSITEGWQGAVPACGSEGAYIVGCGLLAICVSETETRPQECH